MAVKQFHIIEHPTSNLVQIMPLTKKAKKWLKDNLQTEGWQWLGNTVAIDIRYYEAIKEGIDNEF